MTNFFSKSKICTCQCWPVQSTAAINFLSDEKIWWRPLRKNGWSGRRMARMVIMKSLSWTCFQLNAEIMKTLWRSIMAETFKMNYNCHHFIKNYSNVGNSFRLHMENLWLRSRKPDVHFSDWWLTLNLVIAQSLIRDLLRKDVYLWQYQSSSNSELYQVIQTKVQVHKATFHVTYQDSHHKFASLYIGK